MKGKAEISKNLKRRLDRTRDWYRESVLRDEELNVVKSFGDEAETDRRRNERTEGHLV